MKGMSRQKTMLPAFVMAAVTFGAATFAAPAHADIKLVVAVTVTGGPAPANTGPTLDPATHKTWMAYFKGRKARREAENSTIYFLYDKEAGKVYSVDTVAKTYSVADFKTALSNGSGFPDGSDAASRLTIDTSVELETAEDAPDASRTIAGDASKKFTLYGEVTESRKSNGEGGGGGGGRRGRGGGFPGGGGRGGGGGFPGGGGGFPLNLAAQTGGGQNRNEHLPHDALSGDLWLADAETILPNVKKDERELSLALLQDILPGYSPLLDPLSSQLAKKHLVPLASRLTLRMYNGIADPVADNGRENPSASASPTVPLTIATEVQSVDSHVALEDAFFQIPAGYDRVPAPAPVPPLPLPNQRPNP